MKQLFQTVFKNQSYRFLLSVTICAMCLLTFASQLEIFTLGIITKKGPDFFELFAPVQDDQLQRTDVISKSEVIQKWDAIDTQNTGQITKKKLAHTSSYGKIAISLIK